MVTCALRPLLSVTSASLTASTSSAGRRRIPYIRASLAIHHCRASARRDREERRKIEAHMHEDRIDGRTGDVAPPSEYRAGGRNQHDDSPIRVLKPMQSSEKDTRDNDANNGTERPGQQRHDEPAENKFFAERSDNHHERAVQDHERGVG